MTGDEGISPLTRLLRHRRLDIAAPPRLADVTDCELLPLQSGTPSPDLLRRLAPALGLHTADLFATIDIDMPEDLAPLDPRAGSCVPELVGKAIALPSELREALLQFVVSLPQEQRAQPLPEPKPHEQYPPGPGGLLMRMAWNRNLGWVTLAKTMPPLTGQYWAASTYGAIGHGRKELTSDLLTDFAAVLDVPVGDLAVLTGVESPDASPVLDPPVAGVPELVWEVRRLSARQLREVLSYAESMTASPNTTW